MGWGRNALFAASVAAILISTPASPGSARSAHAAPPAPAPASPWTWEAVYTGDLVGIDRSAARLQGRYLDNLKLVLDADLEQLVGWRGARLHISGLANHGAKPNDLAGTLQGIDNIEVGQARARLFEFWAEQDLPGGGSVLAGLYDVNSEFYVTESAGVLMNPAFGIGSELASTGPNGPSIFPSTALAVRLRLGAPTGHHLQMAAVNAEASTLGDARGVDTRFDQGLLLIAEAGTGDRVRFATGVWRYSKRQDDIRLTDLSGAPVSTTAEGVYALVDAEIYRAPGGRGVRVFARVGASDGDTTEFQGGWQAGVLMDHVLASRPHSRVSFGVQSGDLSKKALDNRRDGGMITAPSEQGVELTASDTFGRLTLQPAVQIIRRADGDREAGTVVITTLRASVRFN